MFWIGLGVGIVVSGIVGYGLFAYAGYKMFERW